MNAMILAAALMIPTADRPFHFTISHIIAPDAVILLELPVPESGKRFKRITLDQFKKHKALILYLEYELKEIKLDGLIIRRAVFVLPTPPAPKKEDAISGKATGRAD